MFFFYFVRCFFDLGSCQCINAFVLQYFLFVISASFESQTKFINLHQFIHTIFPNPFFVGSIIFSCFRHFFKSDPFLNCVLMWRPNLSMVFKYISGPSLPTENPTAVKKSSAVVDCCFLSLFLPPFFLKPWNLLPHCSTASFLKSAGSFILLGDFEIYIDNPAISIN